MTRVAVSKWGNSSAIRLPKAVMEELGLKQGEVIEMTVKDGKAVIEKQIGRQIPTLEWIGPEMKRPGPEKEPPTGDWGPDRGSEIIDDEYSRRR